MAQPSYVPIIEPDQVRASYRLGTPVDWRADRPADLTRAEQPRGRSLGVPGPDQGYAHLLAHQVFSDRVVLDEGESLEDVLEGATAVATARAALFGRAPVAKDIELALTVFGYLGGGPSDLIAWRRTRFQGAAHHYESGRALVHLVPESTLRMTAEGVRARLNDWRSLITTGD